MGPFVAKFGFFLVLALGPIFAAIAGLVGLSWFDSTRRWAVTALGSSVALLLLLDLAPRAGDMCLAVLSFTLLIIPVALVAVAVCLALLGLAAWNAFVLLRAQSEPARRRKAARFLTCMMLCIVGLCAPPLVRAVVLGTAPLGTYLRAFDAEAWRTGPADSRWAMIGDLVGSVAPGKSYRELQSILQESSGRTERAGRLVIFYRVDNFALSEIDLVLTFDKNDIYEGWELDRP